MKFNSLFLSIIISIFISKSFALTNSEVAESTEWTNVMLIRSDAPDSTGDTAPGFCNATLIHQNVMITAAHCLVLAYVSGMKKITLQIGNYKYINRKSDGKLVRIGYVDKYILNKEVSIEFPQSLVDKIAVRGEKAMISPSEDVAIAWWKEETPELANIQLADVISPIEHIELIKNLNQKNLQVVTVNPFSGVTSDTKRIATLNNFKWNGYIHSKSLSRVEPGDSGGPLFVQVNGKNKILAVVKGKATTVFDNWDAYSAVGPSICQMANKLPTFIKIEACK